ncbi:HutD family protein [Cystobacter fuscus]
MRRWGPTDYRDMPWKNGGGITRELLRLPHPGEPERFLLRLSIATVASSGPFSLFPGVDRTLLFLEGEGMALRREGAPEVVLERGSAPFRFPGEVPFESRLLGGPVRDFNLMVDRELAEARLDVVELAAGGEYPLEGRGSVWLYGLEGRAEVSGEPLAEQELLGWDAPGRLCVRGVEEARAVLIQLTPRGR